MIWTVFLVGIAAGFLCGLVLSGLLKPRRSTSEKRGKLKK